MGNTGLATKLYVDGWLLNNCYCEITVHILGEANAIEAEAFEKWNPISFFTFPYFPPNFIVWIDKDIYCLLNLKKDQGSSINDVLN